MNIEEKDFPGLYQAADKASLAAQKKYFQSIGGYLVLLILAVLFAYFSTGRIEEIIKIISTVFFLLTLSITIWLKMSRPNDIWYNGRAVAESVKTRAWRWMMGTDPYAESENADMIRKRFVGDLKQILTQNKSLVQKLGKSASLVDPITSKMVQVRNMDLDGRFTFYKENRIIDQAKWYSKKAKLNEYYATRWFWVSISLQVLAILSLLYNIKEPQINLPIEVYAVAASSVLSWIQSKQYNELSSSYTLTAHEIILLKGEVEEIKTESDFSEYVINCENAFSREHTQWAAKKSD
ncbi:MAG: hypothetical protein K0S09_1416 [Sphingobacteriaceae bacterium]|jgi:hypothetical protein|nr:hypothetical protein [Sphingobacteriaceae bacterium]